MSLSPNGVFLGEVLDDPFEFLVEQESSHLISEETSSFFDIGQTFSTALLEDIDLDLQCEDDDVDDTLQTFCGKFAANERNEIVRHSLPNGSSSFTAQETKYQREFQSLQHDICRTVAETSLSLPDVRQNDQSKRLDTIQKSLPDRRTQIKRLDALSSELITCAKCSIQFSNHTALLAHNEDKHVHKEEVLGNECLVCGEFFQNRRALVRHVKYHKQEQKIDAYKHYHSIREFQCDLCIYVGKTRTLLNNHIKARHDYNRAIFRCDKCPFTCLQERTMVLHAQRHAGDPKFACDQCGKLFVSMIILKRHAHTHNKIRAFVCQIPGCDKTFNIKSRLTDHLRSVHRNQIKSMDVNSAFYPSTTSSPVIDNRSDGCDVHIANHLNCMTSSNSFAEVEGPSTSASVSPANSHCVCVYDVILPDDKIQSFNQTSEESVRISNLSHSLLCDQRASAQSTFPQGLASNSAKYTSKNMNRKTHDKKFACQREGCGKKFRDNYNLRIHMYTHTGETQRACHLCRYRCVQKSAMDAHMKTHRKLT